MITNVLPLSDLKNFLQTPNLIDPDSMVAIIGDIHDLPEPRITIINSRQHRNPHADDPWLAATVNAVDKAIAQSYTVVSSIDMITWEWILWNISRLKGYQLIIIPRGKVSHLPDRAHHIIHEFNLNPKHTVFLMPFFPAKKPYRKSTYPERDCWAVALSHIIQPIAVRRGGMMSKLLSEHQLPHKIDRSYQIPSQKTKAHQNELRQLLANDQLLTLNARLNAAVPWDYLTHWTRTCHGPWQGERKANFYQDIFHAKSGYPRDGFQTLKRILKEGRIRGSDRLMPGSHSMISLTATAPFELLKIIRWRPAFIRWNFEPFGISIKKATLESHGALPVTYGTNDQHNRLPEAKKPFFQRIEPEGKNWRVEKEWRHPGDLDLTRLGRDDAIVWVTSPNQIPEIQTISPFPVQALFN
jgi:hypothetical protein